MWNLKVITIMLILITSSFIFPVEFDDLEDDQVSLDEQAVSQPSGQPVSRSDGRPAQDDAHGGSWLDSFEDDTNVEWAMSDHLRLDEGDE